MMTAENNICALNETEIDEVSGGHMLDAGLVLMEMSIGFAIRYFLK